MHSTFFLSYYPLSRYQLPIFFSGFATKPITKKKLKLSFPPHSQPFHHELESLESITMLLHFFFQLKLKISYSMFSIFLLSISLRQPYLSLINFFFLLSFSGHFFSTPPFESRSFYSTEIQQNERYLQAKLSDLFFSVFLFRFNKKGANYACHLRIIHQKRGHPHLNQLFPSNFIESYLTIALRSTFPDHRH